MHEYHTLCLNIVAEQQKEHPKSSKNKNSGHLIPSITALKTDDKRRN